MALFLAPVKSVNAKGGSLLSIEVPENVMTEYEWVEEEKPYREFLMPAEVANKYPITLLALEDPTGMMLLKKEFMAGDITVEVYKIKIEELRQRLKQRMKVHKKSDAVD
jgi:hypothetical protein